MQLLVQSPVGTPRMAPLTRGVFLIGRSQDCDLALHDDLVSRYHAELRRYGDQWLLVDLGSANGTYLGEQRLQPQVAQALTPSDSFTIGSTVMRLQASAPQPQPVPLTPVSSLSPQVQSSRPKPVILVVGTWLSRILAVIASVLLLVGVMGDWLRLQVTLPLIGQVVDRTLQGIDSDYGWLLLGISFVPFFFVFLDIGWRRWGMAIGLGMVLLGILVAIIMFLNVYSYYRILSQSIFGISLLDILERYASEAVSITLYAGLYLVVAGLLGLVVAGVTRMIAAGLEPVQE